jgi:hypothetical protein
MSSERATCWRKKVAQLTIPDPLWRQLSAAARRQRQAPERLAEQALRDFLQRAADEDLLARSEQAARRQRFRIHEAEKLVREHRRQAGNR